MASQCVPRAGLPVADTTIFGTASLLALAMNLGDAVGATRAVAVDARPSGGGVAPLGRWASDDGGVRLEIRPDGRYTLDIAGRRRRSHGTYRAERLTVLLETDGGLRTTAQLDGDTLELAGHRLHRQR
jgi:hypothetical protein